MEGMRASNLQSRRISEDSVFEVCSLVFQEYQYALDKSIWPSLLHMYSWTKVYGMRTVKLHYRRRAGYC